MNIDKYGEGNFLMNYLGLSLYEIKGMKYYTKFIGDLDVNSKIVEIGPGNGKFLIFLKQFYGLFDKNIYSVDISRSIFNNISTHSLTKGFNNNLSDVIDFFTNNNTKYDLIIMKHVLEHMKKDYIIKLVPLLISSLTERGKLLVEVPNMANFPLGYAGFFLDFSHMTGFTDNSLKQVFNWYCSEEIDISVYNLYIYPLNFSNPLALLKSIIVKTFYYGFCVALKFFYKFANFNFEVTTTAILAIIKKKN